MNFEIISHNIKIIRLSKQISQKELSERAELKNASRVSNIEENRGKVTLEELFRISNVLNVNLDNLVRRKVSVRYEWSNLNNTNDL